MPQTEVSVLISAGAEWRAMLPHYPGIELEATPYGDWFSTSIRDRMIGFLHGGWGKVAAAASTQYAIDRWNPQRIINVGTCGGFMGQIERGEVILAQKTIIYDIVEQMTDAEAAIRHYAVEQNLSWLPDPPPQPIRIGTIVSADRDILSKDVPELIHQYNAKVADWESGAIAWTSLKNNRPCLILRGVSDLVGEGIGEAYGKYDFFEAQCNLIMGKFAKHLPDWIEAFTAE